jgi:hypothetical protein
MRKIVERSLRQAGVNLTQVLEAGNGAESPPALTVQFPKRIRSCTNADCSTSGLLPAFGWAGDGNMNVCGVSEGN